MSETEKVDVSTDLLEQQKAKAVEYLRMQRGTNTTTSTAGSSRKTSGCWKEPYIQK